MFLLRASTWILLMLDVRGSGLTAEQAFSAIYKHDRWGGGSNQTAGGGSGAGSSEAGAIGASRIIFHLAMKYALSGIVDAPCGAMAWQESLVNQLQHAIPGFRYLGLDVVQSVVERNRARFVSWPNVTFVEADLTRPESVQVKQGANGLLFSRDSMMHNTLEGCWQMLDTFTRSPVKYVLLGSYGADKPGRRNGAVQIGRWFSIQLDKPPFGMQYIEKIPEANIVGENKYMFLYDRKALRKELIHRGHIKLEPWPRRPGNQTRQQPDSKPANQANHQTGNATRQSGNPAA